MPWRLQGQPTTIERICGGLSYLTYGIAGLLYILLSKNSGQSQLFRFHMYQAVFLCILGTLFSWAINPLVGIITNVMAAFAPGAAAALASAVGMITIVVSGGFTLVLIYGAVCAFLGKFAEVPFISPLVRQNMRF
jgi:uncharacterized membrane protein